VEAFHNAVTAVLTIRGAAKAVAFYERAFGAEEIYRNTYPDGRIVAELAVGEARFRVADEAPEAGNLSPEALGGTSVRLNLLVADPDGVAAVAIANGAIEVAPVADQSYGLRQGRLADPFGHHWLECGANARNLPSIPPVPYDRSPLQIATPVSSNYWRNVTAYGATITG
jgi:PhnB protein